MKKKYIPAKPASPNLDYNLPCVYEFMHLPRKNYYFALYIYIYAQTRCCGEKRSVQSRYEDKTQLNQIKE